MYNLIDTRRKLSSFSDVEIWKQARSKVIHTSILDFIGNTPLIKLNKIPKDYGLSCEIYAKCEFMNPSGSIKDRIALAMMRDAEKNGRINENSQFVEPSSGNTGIGIAFNCALKGNKCIIVTAEKNSAEKVNTIRLLGAEAIQTHKSSSEIAHEIVKKNPNIMIMLDQFNNPVNPKCHYEGTAVEILSALGEVDMVVMGTGTGGTMTGVGHKFKDENPKCKVVVAEPDGSTMVNVNGKSHPFLVEGIGGSTAPKVLDKSVIDHFEVVTDEESFLMAREIVQKEGLLCGGSSGTAMLAAIRAASKLKIGAGQKVVVILPDGIRNYMSKFVSDQWMEAHLFMDPPKHTMRWWDHPVTELSLTHKYPILEVQYTCAEAVREMKDCNIAIVVDDKGWFVGAISKDSLRNSATNPTKLPDSDSENFNFNDVVTEHLTKDCYTLAKNGKKGMPTIGLLSRMLDITSFVVIGKNVNDNDTVRFVPESVVTADDVFNYIFTHCCD